jgi:hypothetical protein
MVACAAAQRSRPHPSPFCSGLWDADQGGALAAFLSRIQLPTWPVTGNPRVLAKSRDELIEHYFRVGPRLRLTIASTPMACGGWIGQHRPSGVGEDRNIDTARTIEGGIGHELPQEAPGAFTDAMLKAGRS